MALVNVIPDLGGSFAYRLRVSARSRLGLARGRGSATGSVGAAVVWLLIEGGHGELAVGTESLEVGGREDVFEAPGWSALLGSGTRFAVRGTFATRSSAAPGRGKRRRGSCRRARSRWNAEARGPTSGGTHDLGEGP